MFLVVLPYRVINALSPDASRMAKQLSKTSPKERGRVDKAALRRAGRLYFPRKNGHVNLGFVYWFIEGIG